MSLLGSRLRVSSGRVRLGVLGRGSSSWSGGSGGRSGRSAARRGRRRGGATTLTRHVD